MKAHHWLHIRNTMQTSMSRTECLSFMELLLYINHGTNNGVKQQTQFRHKTVKYIVIYKTCHVCYASMKQCPSSLMHMFCICKFWLRLLDVYVERKDPDWQASPALYWAMQVHLWELDSVALPPVCHRISSGSRECHCHYSHSNLTSPSTFLPSQF